MSIFSSWLQAELNTRGWNQRTAAQAFGVVETVVHNWLHKGVRPNGKNLLKVSMALRVPLDEVARAAGYDDIPLFKNEREAADARIAVLAALPQFAEVIDLVARKPLEQQATYIELIRRLLLDRPPATDPVSK